MVKMEDKNRFLTALSTKTKQNRIEGSLLATDISENSKVPQKIVDDCLAILKEDSSKVISRSKTTGAQIL